MNNIFIIDGRNDSRLDHINKQDVLKNEHEQDLPTQKETFNFTAFAERRYAEHLGKRNGLIAPGEDGELLEFRIFESHKYDSREGKLVDVYSRATYLDLVSAKKINPHVTSPETAKQHAETALDSTEWQVGEVDYVGIRTLTFENYTNPYAYLKRIATEFELELRFYITTDGNGVTGRYVDLIDRIGESRGRTVEFASDLQSIRRVEKTDEIVTALYGIGPEDENGNRLEVFVEDLEALERWGRKGKHIVDVYEPQSDRSEMTLTELRQYTRTELNKRINAVVSYESEIVDLENVSGLENKKIRFADTIRIKDLKFSPPLYLEARIFNQKRDVFVKSNKRVELGDYIEYTQEEVLAIWKVLQQQIRNKISAAELVEYAEPKKVLSDTPPENKNVIWVDTSQVPYIPKVNNFDEWEKMTPTKADEVGAYDKDETDNITKDASRLTDGILNVGAVPLRTSENGTRIVWDGVNGLVQYDENDIPVTWLDLEGNFYATNGYFSGDIEGSTITGSSFSTTLGAGVGRPYQAVNIDQSGFLIQQRQTTPLNVEHYGKALMNAGPHPSTGTLITGMLTLETWNSDVGSSTKYNDRKLELTPSQFTTGGSPTYTFDIPNIAHFTGSIGASKVESSQIIGSRAMLWFIPTADQVQVRNVANNGYADFRARRITTDDILLYSVTGRYNANFPMLQDHDNGNVSVNGSGGDLHLGYFNTDEIFIKRNGRLYADSEYFRIYAGATGTGNHIRITNADGAVSFVQGGAFRHIFAANGTKTGGSYEFDDGIILGMSPTDSPQVLIEYVEFDIPLSKNGTKVYLDSRYRESIYNFAVFPSNGSVIEKGQDYFIVSGDGFADIHIVGERLGEEGLFWDDMKGYENDDQS
jgi:phage minor structural protein